MTVVAEVGSGQWWRLTEVVKVGEEVGSGRCQQWQSTAVVDWERRWGGGGGGGGGSRPSTAVVDWQRWWGGGWCWRGKSTVVVDWEEGEVVVVVVVDRGG